MRRGEKEDHFICPKGLLEIAFANVSKLVQETKVYTITLTKVFEEECRRSNLYSYKKANKDEKHKFYYVWQEKIDPVAHVIIHHKKDFSIECIGKSFKEVGYLYYHCLRI